MNGRGLLWASVQCRHFCSLHSSGFVLLENVSYPPSSMYCGARCDMMFGSFCRKRVVLELERVLG